MAESIYTTKSTILVVVILTSIILIGAPIGLIVWISFDSNYGIGEIVIQKDQDFENRYEFPGSGTLNDPYLISDYNIETSKEYAIYIEGTSKYFLITNCTIKCQYNGISVENAAEGTTHIENNFIQATSAYSIYLIYISQSRNSFIINNLLSNIHQQRTYSAGIIITHSQNSLISNNTCNKLNVGISVHYSDATLVEFNYIEFSDEGIRLDNSDSTIVRYNGLYYNRYFGLQTNNGLSCIFHHNNFINNALALHYDAQAYDSESNIWYDISNDEGNYWSDLVWDDNATYEIDGNSGSIDFYPLQFPVVI